MESRLRSGQLSPKTAYCALFTSSVDNCYLDETIWRSVMPLPQLRFHPLTWAASYLLR